MAEQGPDSDQIQRPAVAQPRRRIQHRSMSDSPSTHHQPHSPHIQPQASALGGHSVHNPNPQLYSLAHTGRKRSGSQKVAGGMIPPEKRSRLSSQQPASHAFAPLSVSQNSQAYPSWSEPAAIKQVSQGQSIQGHQGANLAFTASGRSVSSVVGDVAVNRSYSQPGPTTSTRHPFATHPAQAVSLSLHKSTHFTTHAPPNSEDHSKTKPKRRTNSSKIAVPKRALISHCEPSAEEKVIDSISRRKRITTAADIPFGYHQVQPLLNSGVDTFREPEDPTAQDESSQPHLAGSQKRRATPRLAPSNATQFYLDSAFVATALEKLGAYVQSGHCPHTEPQLQVADAWSQTQSAGLNSTSAEASRDATLTQSTSKHHSSHLQDSSHTTNMQSGIGVDGRAPEQHAAHMNSEDIALEEPPVNGIETSLNEKAQPATVATAGEPDKFLNEMFDFDQLEKDQEDDVALAMGGSPDQADPLLTPGVTSALEAVPLPDLSRSLSNQAAFENIERMLASKPQQLRDENKEVLHPDASTLTEDQSMLRESLNGYFKTSEDLDKSVQGFSNPSTEPANGASRCFIHDPILDPRAEAGISSQVKPAANNRPSTIFANDSLARLPGAEADWDDERDQSLDLLELRRPNSVPDFPNSPQIPPHNAEETAAQAWPYNHDPERNRMAVPHEFQLPSEIQSDTSQIVRPKSLTASRARSGARAPDRQQEAVTQAAKQGSRYKNILEWQHDDIPELEKAVDKGLMAIAQRTCEAKRQGDQPERVRKHFEALKSGALPKTYPPIASKQLFTFAKFGSSIQTVKDSLDPADANKKEDELTSWKKARKECLGYWDKEFDRWTQEPPAELLVHFRNAKVATHVALQSQLTRETVTRDLDRLTVLATSEQKKIWTPQHHMMTMCSVSRSPDNPLNFPFLEDGQKGGWALLKYESTAWYHLKLDLDDLTKWLKQESARYESLQRVQKTAVQTTPRQAALRSDKSHSKALASGLVDEAQLLQALNPHERPQTQGPSVPHQHAPTPTTARTESLPSTSAAVANDEANPAVVDDKQSHNTHQISSNHALPDDGHKGHVNTAGGLTSSLTTQNAQSQHGASDQTLESPVSWETIQAYYREDANTLKSLNSTVAQMLSDKKASLTADTVEDPETLAKLKSETNNLAGKAAVEKAAQNKFNQEKPELLQRLDLYDERAHRESVVSTVQAKIQQQCRRARDFENWRRQQHSAGQQYNNQLAVDFYVSLLRKYPRPPDMYHFIHSEKEKLFKQYKHAATASGTHLDHQQHQMLERKAFQMAHEEWMSRLDKVKIAKDLQERAAKSGVRSNPNLQQKISAEVTRFASKMAADRQVHRDYWATYLVACQQRGLDPNEAVRRAYAERKWEEQKTKVEQEKAMRDIYKNTLKDLRDRHSTQTGNQTTPEQDEKLKETARKRADSYQREMLALRNEAKTKLERRVLGAGQALTPHLQAQIDRTATDAARRRYAEKNPGASVPGTPVSQLGSFLFPATSNPHSEASPARRPAHAALGSSTVANSPAQNNGWVPVQGTVTSQAGSPQQSHSQWQTTANNNTGACYPTSSSQQAARRTGFDGSTSTPTETPSPARKRPYPYEDPSPARKKPTPSPRKTSSTTQNPMAPPPTPKFQSAETGLGLGKNSGLGLSGPSGTKRPPNSTINLVSPSPEPESQPGTLHKTASQMTGAGKSPPSRPTVAKKGPKEGVPKSGQTPASSAPMAPMGHVNYAPRVPSPLVEAARPAAPSPMNQYRESPYGQPAHQAPAEFANVATGGRSEFMLSNSQQRPATGTKRKGDPQTAGPSGPSKRQRPEPRLEVTRDARHERQLANISDWQWRHAPQTGQPISMVPPTPSRGLPPITGGPSQGNDAQSTHDFMNWGDFDMIPDTYSHREDHFAAAIDPANDLGYNESNNHQSTRADGTRGISVNQVGQEYGALYRGPMPSYGAVMRDLHQESQEDLERRAFNPRSYAVQQEVQRMNAVPPAGPAHYGWAFNHESESDMLVRVQRPMPVVNQGVSLDHIENPDENTASDGDRPRDWKN